MSTPLTGKVAIVTGSSRGGTRMLMSGTALYLGSKGAVEQFVLVLSSDDARWVTGQNVGAGGGVF